MAQDPKIIIKKRDRLLVFFAICIILLIVSIILVAVLVINDDWKLGINLSLLGVILVVTLLFRRPLFSRFHLAKVATLILKQGKPLPYTNSVVTNPGLLLKSGFLQAVNTQKFSIFYRHTKNPSALTKKVFKLELALVIKDNSLDYYDQAIETEIKKIEDSFTRIERPTKYIIIGYKNFENVDEGVLKQLSEIVCYTVQRFHYSQINVGFSTKEKKVYFLYSDTYNPSQYYKQGVEFIKKISGGAVDLYYYDPLANNKKGLS